MEAAAELPEVSDISQEFLEALPEDIREEVLQQEMLSREMRNRRTHAAAPGASASGGARTAAGIPAAFSSLLEMMGERDSAFMQVFNAFQDRPEPGSAARPAAANQQSEKFKDSIAKPRREPKQLMDRNALAAVVRYLFLPQPLTRSFLYPLMVNLTENGKCRAELVYLLIGIIHECLSADKSDKSRAARGSRTSLAGGRKSLSSNQLQTIVAPLIASNGSENFVTMAIHRCLDLCMELVSKNEAVTTFFLTEIDSDETRSRSLKRKHGKSLSRYPITELLSLMEKPVFLRNMALMDDLTQLIAAVVQPLSRHRPSSSASSRALNDIVPDPVPAPNAGDGS
jgi:E3 ubiquitin-protein ligase HUWE1